MELFCFLIFPNILIRFVFVAIAMSGRRNTVCVFAFFFVSNNFRVKTKMMEKAAQTCTILFFQKKKNSKIFLNTNTIKQS